MDLHTLPIMSDEALSVMHDAIVQERRARAASRCPFTDEEKLRFLRSITALARNDDVGALVSMVDLAFRLGAVEAGAPVSRALVDLVAEAAHLAHRGNMDTTHRNMLELARLLGEHQAVTAREDL